MRTLPYNCRLTIMVATACLALSAVGADAGTLSCVVTTSCGSGVTIFRMSNTTNAHAELPGQSNYANLVCCTGVAGLGTACSGTFATALRLSGTTNAHVQQNTQSGYANDVCISAPSGGSVSVGYVASPTTCTGAGYDTLLGSMSGVSNAHVGDGSAYDTKICASAAVAAAVSIVLTTDGSVAYGTLVAGGSRSTLQLGDSQTAENDGTVSEDFQVRGQDTACPWTLAGSAGAEQYMHEVSTNGGTDWIALNTGYQTIAADIAPNDSRTVDMRITTPTATTCFTQQSADIVIQAVQH